MLRRILLAAAPAASAANTAVAVTKVNLRTGPSTIYPAVTVVPAGTAITTFGCVSGYSWCDIRFGPYRGWVAASCATFCSLRIASSATFAFKPAEFRFRFFVIGFVLSPERTKLSLLSGFRGHFSSDMANSCRAASTNNDGASATW